MWCGFEFVGVVVTWVPSQVQRGGLSKIFVLILNSDLSIAFRPEVT
jgi:hypothetical protein